MEQETKEDGTQRFLMKLLESKLTDDDLLNEFYDKIISVYNYPENYFIILTHDAYDIPKITSDGVKTLTLRSMFTIISSAVSVR